MMNTQLLKQGLMVSVAAIGTVAGATSAQASTFSRVDLDPQLQTLFNQQFVQTERVAINNPEFKRVDPSQLWFQRGAESLQVFFINEGAAFRNQLSFSVNNGSDQMIFDDIASTQSIIKEKDGPLTLGEGRDLGNLAAGSALNFTLMADTSAVADANRGRSAEQALDREKYSYSTSEVNPDQLQHVVAYQYDDFLILGFEDLYGALGLSGEDPNNPGFFFERSDRDFNDVVIAVRGATTVKAEAVPEPGTLMAMAGVATVGGLQALRRKMLGA